MPLQVRDEGRVRILVLDRPERRNALSASLREELVTALRTAQDDDAIGAVVLTGEGKCFAAGADLEELLERTPQQQRTFLSPPHIYSVIEGHSKPVLAAINGHALGAGLELATACDVRVAAPQAKLGQPEVHLGLLPGGGGTQRLVRLVGKGMAARLVLTGEAVPAEEAYRIGLVEEVADDPVARAVALAKEMADKDPVALAAAKDALRTAWGADYEAGLAAEVERFVRLHGRDEARRRIQAFLDR